MTGNKLVSVIIPAYNHECYVQESISSVICQSYRNLELIIIDDGSSDATFSKIMELQPACQKRFVRLIMQSQKNKGLSDTLNLALNLAQGEYCYTIASDDIADPSAVESLVLLLEKNPEAVLAVGDNEIIDSEGKKVGWDENRQNCPLQDSTFHTFGEFLGLLPCKDANQEKDGDFGSYERLLRGNHIPNGQLIRRSSLKKAGPYLRDYLFEDWYMNLQLAKQGKFLFYPVTLFYYRWHESNTVKSKEYLEMLHATTCKLFRNEKDYCRQNGYYTLWKKRCPSLVLFQDGNFKEKIVSIFRLISKHCLHIFISHNRFYIIFLGYTVIDKKFNRKKL